MTYEQDKARIDELSAEAQTLNKELTDKFEESIKAQNSLKKGILLDLFDEYIQSTADDTDRINAEAKGNRNQEVIIDILSDQISIINYYLDVIDIVIEHEREEEEC